MRGNDRPMLAALLLAIAEIGHPTLRRTVLLSVGLALLVFAALWGGLGALLVRTHLFGNWFFDAALDVLGGVAALLVTWLVFPAVVTVIASFLLDEVVAEIEARHYPALPPARPQAWNAVAFGALRLASMAIVLNLLALPLYVFLPGVNLVVFYLLNGYLLGREYFELIALRRLEPGAVKAMRRANAGQILLAGAIIAFAFALPLVNLAAPVLGAAFMLHVFQRLRRDPGRESG
jgi:CysZ protein